MRELEVLEKNAVLHWPEELLRKAASVSILSRLLQTQTKFISILNLADNQPDAWIYFVDHLTDMPGNLFLKHLMVLTDVGGELLHKMTPLTKYFPYGEMKYIWHDSEFSYQFAAIHKKTPLNNQALKVDGISALKPSPLTPKMKDVIMLLLYGGFAFNGELPTQLREKCTIGDLLGRHEALERFVRESYIRVSRQLIGAESNALGNVAEAYVVEILQNELPDWKIQTKSSLPGVTHTKDGQETTFDIVAVSPKKHYFAEVSFQVTTNSVIERKAREAEARQKAAHEKGHKVCYVLDGVGNLKVRRSAAATICRHSDCTVTFSRTEIRKLADYLRKQDEKTNGALG